MWKSGGSFWSSWPTATASAATYSELIDDRNAPLRNLAVIDNAGVIVDVNQAWREFAQTHGMDDANHGIGVNYLALCDAVDDMWAERAARSVRAMLAGTIEQSSFIYPCDSPDRRRSFIFETYRFSPEFGIVSHTYLRQLSRLGIL